MKEANALSCFLHHCLTTAGIVSRASSNIRQATFWRSLSEEGATKQKQKRQENNEHKE